MRVIGPLIGSLLLVGFVAAYFWWIAACLALWGFIWIAHKAFIEIKAEEAAELERMRADAKRQAAVARRADQQHAWALVGDPRGTYGKYPPAMID